MRCFLVLAIATTLTLTASAPAQARPASKGPYAEIGVGANRFLGSERNDAAMGFASVVHVGLDLFSWFSVGVRAGVSSHEATVPAPPEGEYFQLYTGAAEARLALRISWLEIYADGSFGGALLSTNILERVGVIGPGERFASIVTAGGGLEYQLQNRHYAFGLAGEWSMMPGFARTQMAGGRLYLRYTY